MREIIISQPSCGHYLLSNGMPASKPKQFRLLHIFIRFLFCFLLLHLRVTEIFLSLPLPWPTKSINQTNDIDSDDSMCQSAPLNYFMNNQLAFFFLLREEKRKTKTKTKKSNGNIETTGAGDSSSFTFAATDSAIQRFKKIKIQKRKKEPHTPTSIKGHKMSIPLATIATTKMSRVSIFLSFSSRPPSSFFFCFLDPKNKQKTEITQLIDWLWAVVKQIKKRDEKRFQVERAPKNKKKEIEINSGQQQVNIGSRCVPHADKRRETHLRTLSVATTKTR